MMIPLAGWVAPFGYPRINACSRLPVAFRSVPRPSSPPGAKASTECPSCARNQPDHAQEPSSPLSERTPRRTRQASNLAHTCVPPPPSRAAASHNAPERMCHRSRGSQHLRKNAAYRSDLRPTARPETHQNLIHPDKDHGARTRRPSANHGRHRLRCGRISFFSATTCTSEPWTAGKQEYYPQMTQITRISKCSRPFFLQRYLRSQQRDLRKSADQASALPPPVRWTCPGMETIGFEPTTPCLQSRCSPS